MNDPTEAEPIDAERVARRQRASALRSRADATSEERRLVENAAAFLRSGGCVSWDRWETLGPVTKRALAVGARVVAAERAEAVAEAIERRTLARAERATLEDAARAALREAGKTC